MAQMTDQTQSYSLSINAHMTVRDMSEVGLAPLITSIFRSRNGVAQCVHVGSIHIRCVHVREKTTEANPNSEKMTENFERQFWKKDVLRSVFSYPFSAQFLQNCQSKAKNSVKVRAMRTDLVT